MNETANALCVLMALFGLAAFTAGWLIITFNRLCYRQWFDALFCLLLLPAPYVAWQRRQKHAFWMLILGAALLCVGFTGSTIVTQYNG